MATTPNTQGIINAIAAYLQGAQVSGSAAYVAVFAGGIKDIINQLPAASVMLDTDGSAHYASGGVIRETQQFLIRSYVTYDSSTDAQTDEQQLIAIRDAIIPIFQTHTTLGGVQGVDDSRVKDGSGKMLFANIGGQWYRVHQFMLQVKQRYTVPLAVQ